MKWDIQSFLDKFRGGFDAGAEKRQQEEQAAAVADKKMKELSAEKQKEMDSQNKSYVDAYEQFKKDELHRIKVEQENLKTEALRKKLENPDTPTNNKTPKSTEPTPSVNPIEWLMSLFGADTPSTEAAQQPTVAPTMAPTSTPTPTPQQPDLNAIAEALKKGFNDYSLKSGYDNPLATMSAEMARAGQDANLPDPYLPATINLKETTGGKFLKHKNNMFNWSDKPLPDLQTAINNVYNGIGSTAPNGTYDENGYGGLYKDYLKTGNLEDFFRVYTPSSDPNNPSYEEQIRQFKQLRGYFPSL